MFSRGVENGILVFIVLFAILTCISVAAGDSVDENQWLTVTSLILLTVFFVELMLKLYSMGVVRDT